MEAIAYYSSSDQPFSPSNNYPRNFNKTIHGHFVTTNYQKGILQAPLLPPVFLSHSFPPFSSSAHHHHQQVVHQQPPLLPLPFPLPISKSAQNNNHNNLNRGLSSPPINGRVNNIDRNKDSFLVVPKKSKKKQSPKSSKVVMIPSNTNPLGPHPIDLPKDVSTKVLSLSSNGNGKLVNSTVVSSKSIENNLQVDKFSGSVVFTISPPPSSLPLPTFSLRPKLSCKSEVDAGATDNLRRLLRL